MFPQHPKLIKSWTSHLLSILPSAGKDCTGNWFGNLHWLKISNCFLLDGVSFQLTRHPEPTHWAAAWLSVAVWVEGWDPREERQEWHTRPRSVRLVLQDSSLQPTAPALHWHTAGTDQLHHWKTWSCLLPPCSAASSFVQANTCMAVWWAGLRVELTWGRGRQGGVRFELDQFAAQTFVLAQRWGWEQAVRGVGCVFLLVTVTHYASLKYIWYWTNSVKLRWYSIESLVMVHGNIYI